MSLTATQKADVRRFAGYPMLADTVADNYSDFAYGFVSPGVWNTLEHRLNNIRVEEQVTLETVYLTNLLLLEQDVVDSRDNVDTAQAAVWYRNSREISEKRDLFDDWRRRMCHFIGIPPGPSLGDGSCTISRG